MMAVKVIEQYRDKYNGNLMLVGRKLTNLTPEREKELLDAGVVEKIPTKKKPQKKAKAKK